jgi:hypothetical protein
MYVRDDGMEGDEGMGDERGLTRSKEQGGGPTGKEGRYRSFVRSFVCWLLLLVGEDSISVSITKKGKKGDKEISPFACR